VEDRQLHNMINKFIYTIAFCLFAQVSFAAGDSSSSSSDSDNYLDQYKAAKKLVNRGKKLESKGKNEKALKLYNSAYKKLLEANKLESRNPDILNYLGFTLRKAGNFDQAEKYYLQGLEIKPNHNGINEYLGELYVKTQRIDLAKERLSVLKNCNCEEYDELKEVIEKN
jgi:Flp pilus assembly protein TadD|tara:strand:- start:162 stop:668 length:507 start_codon:yes stop_codon:yes gene_type:complete